MGFKVYDDVADSASAARTAVTTPEEHALLMRKRVQFDSACAETLKHVDNQVLDGVEWTWGKIEQISMLACFVLLSAMTSRE